MVISDLIPVLWLCGPPGIGKSTVSWEIFTQLTQAGTQFTVTDGELGPCPIEDRQRLDERRAEAGLESFADYEARMRDQS